MHATTEQASKGYQPWKSPNLSALLIYRKYKIIVDTVHLKHRQTAENVLYYWLFSMWEPPAQGKIWPWLLPDKGGVSCHYVGPSVRLMNGGFYLETTRELQWRKECQVGNEEKDLGGFLVWAGFSKKTLRVVTTHGVYVHAEFTRCTQACKDTNICGSHKC